MAVTQKVARYDAKQTNAKVKLSAVVSLNNHIRQITNTIGTHELKYNDDENGWQDKDEDCNRKDPKKQYVNIAIVELCQKLEKSIFLQPRSVP